MCRVLARGKELQNRRDVVLGQLVVVRDLDAFLRRVDEEDRIVTLAFLEDEDAGRDRGAEEEIVGELDDGLDEVVVDEILADLLLRAATVHDAWEGNDSRRSVRCEPGERVHHECEVGLRLRGEDARRCEARIVDQHGIRITLPLD